MMIVREKEKDEETTLKHLIQFMYLHMLNICILPTPSPHTKIESSKHIIFNSIGVIE